MEWGWCILRERKTPSVTSLIHHNGVQPSQISTQTQCLISTIFPKGLRVLCSPKLRRRKSGRKHSLRKFGLSDQPSKDCRWFQEFLVMNSSSTQKSKTCSPQCWEPFVSTTANTCHSFPCLTNYKRRIPRRKTSWACLAHTENETKPMCQVKEDILCLSGSRRGIFQKVVHLLEEVLVCSQNESPGTECKNVTRNKSSLPHFLFFLSFFLSFFFFLSLSFQRQITLCCH